MSNARLTFVDRCLAGDAFVGDISDFVDRWHDGDCEGVSLHEYLGMTVDEYRLWVERPEVINYIFFARRTGEPFAGATAWADNVVLAARADSPEKAEGLREWLVKTGRLTH